MITASLTNLIDYLYDVTSQLSRPSSFSGLVSVQHPIPIYPKSAWKRRLVKFSWDYKTKDFFTQSGVTSEPLLYDQESGSVVTDWCNSDDQGITPVGLCWCVTCDQRKINMVAQSWVLWRDAKFARGRDSE